MPITFFHRPRLVGALLLVALPASVPAETTDYSDYIAAVRADLEEFNSGKFTLAESNSWNAKASGENDGTASLADFEEFVKTKFRGTYILFVRLPEWQKNQIWQEYLETGDLGGIRTNIYAARQGKSPSQKRDSITNLPFDF